MEFYVIRHKPTQTFMPGRGLSTHYDFDRPPGTHEPRLFKTERAAKNCATCWAQGIWHAEIKTESEGWEYPTYEYQDCPVPNTVPGRKRDDLEVLKVTLTVESDRLCGHTFFQAGDYPPTVECSKCLLVMSRDDYHRLKA